MERSESRIYVFSEIDSNVDSNPEILQDIFLKTSVKDAAQQTHICVPLLHPSRDGDEKTLRANIWQKGFLPVAPDVNASVLTLLKAVIPGQEKKDGREGGDAGNETGSRAKSVPVCQLTPHGQNLFNGKYCKPSGNYSLLSPEDQACFKKNGMGLSIDLSPKAKKRLAGIFPADSIESLDVNLEQATVFFLDVPVLVMEFSILLPKKGIQQEYAAASEIMHVLANPVRYAHLGLAALNQSWRKQHTKGLSLTSWMGGLCQSSERAIRGNERFYTYASIIVPEGSSMEEMTYKARIISRHYTSDYKIEALAKTDSALSTFKDIVHAFSMEGSATVVSETFEENFDNRLKTAYLFFLVITYSEYLKLSYLSQKMISASSDVFSTAEAGHGKPLSNAIKLQKVTQIFDELIAFQWRYRLPVVSGITMHNDFYHAIRDSFCLEQMSDKIDHDTVNAKDYLLNLRSEDSAAFRERRAKDSAQSNIRYLLDENSDYEKEKKKTVFRSSVMFGVTFLTFSALLKETSELLKNFHFPLAENLETVLDYSSLFVAMGLAVYAAMRERSDIRKKAQSMIDRNTMQIRLIENGNLQNMNFLNNNFDESDNFSESLAEDVGNEQVRHALEHKTVAASVGIASNSMQSGG